MAWRKFLVVILACVVFSGLIVSCGGEGGEAEEPRDEAVEDAEEKVEDEEAAGRAEGKIAYVDGGDIWMINVDGSGISKITDSPGRDYGPSISPDGLGVAFTREDSNRNVYLTSCDGTGLLRLTQGTPGDDFAPAWSPDGGTIAFLSTRDHAGSDFPYAELYLMDPDGGDQRRLTQSEYGLENPAAVWWLPDGDEIAVWEMGTGGGTGIALVDPATGQVGRPEALYGILEESGYLGTVINNYVVNPVQERLVACSLADLGSAPGDEGKEGLFIVDLAGGSRTKVDQLSMPISCGWSADGECLYYTNLAREGYYGFYVTGKDGTGKRALDWLPQVQFDDDLWDCTCADFHIEGEVDLGDVRRLHGEVNRENYILIYEDNTVFAAYDGKTCTGTYTMDEYGFARIELSDGATLEHGPSGWSCFSWNGETMISDALLQHQEAHQRSQQEMQQNQGE